MTTNANAKVETRHIEQAGKAHYKLSATDFCDAHAQALANLEAANNRLAEIDRLIKVSTDAIPWGSILHSIAALASGHTPSPCPDCAAKDEAMAEIDYLADTSLDVLDKLNGASDRCAAIRAIASRFINPPADPVAEAFRDAFRDSRIGEIGGYHEIERKFHKALKDHGIELSRLPLGGA